MINKYGKAGILTAVLVMPALFFLLLYSFTENHYQLPYFIPTVDAEGKVIMKGKDTVFYKVPDADDLQIKVVSFLAKDDAKALQQLKRVEKMIGERVKFIHVDDEDAANIAVSKYKVSPLKKTNSSETIPYARQFILIDKEGYIRGFYDGGDVEDVDRLMAEIKVLIDIYQKKEK
ncbi:MAG: hypothetical protein ACK4GN_04365 [Runella sp.]